MSSNYRKLSIAEYGVVLDLNIYISIEEVVRKTVECLIDKEKRGEL